MGGRWTVLYDADCGFCIWLLSAFLCWDRPARLRAIALQRSEADDLLQELAPAQRMASWHLISPSGERSSGGAALAPLLRALPGGRLPAAVFARLPSPTDRGYRWVAEHRSSLSKWVPASAKQRACGRVQRREQQDRGAGERRAPQAARFAMAGASAEAIQSRDARPRARPRPGRRLPGMPTLLGVAARTTPPGAREIVDVPREGSVAAIRASKRSLLVTYRRDGTPVPTPVWAAESGGRLYVRSERAAGKVKRLSRDPRLLVCPCTVRGRPLGPPFEATARVLPRGQESTAEHALRYRYGLGRALFESLADVMRVDMCYLEIVPSTGRNAGTSATMKT